jgi:hypothetical protein
VEIVIIFVLPNSKEMTNNMEMIKSKIEIGEQILASRGNQTLFVATIVDETEKAIKVDCTLDSIWNNSVCVFTHSMFIPKSVVINSERGDLTLKKWFINSLDLKYKIKPYFIKDNNKIYL